MDSTESPRVLWIASEQVSTSFAQECEAAGYQMEQAAGFPEAREYLTRSRVSVVVIALPLPGYRPAEALDELQRVDAAVPVILLDRAASVAEAIQLVKAGAFDVLEPEALAGRLPAVIAEAIAERGSSPRAEPGAESWEQALVGNSASFVEVVRLVRLVAARRATVLITGETGTGKEMIAQAIHAAGPRRRLPMVAVCCSAIPENLLEAELFGHVRGAFTGALNQRIGRFEQAHGSTLFLDEIGDMPLELQAKLLRVLQTREFQRLGSCDTIRVDVRVLAATNADLLDRVRQGRFREDLYYRLNVVPIQLPALRARPGDVPVLARHFAGRICALEGLPPKRITRDAMGRLAAYSWPGNVRQLENAVERAAIMSGERDTLYPADFPLEGYAARPLAAQPSEHFVRVPDDGLDFEQTVGQIARGILEQALQKTKGNKKMAADLLRLKRTTLAAKLRSLETGDADLSAMATDFIHCA